MRRFPPIALSPVLFLLFHALALETAIPLLITKILFGLLILSISLFTLSILLDLLNLLGNKRDSNFVDRIKIRSIFLLILLLVFVLWNGSIFVKYVNFDMKEPQYNAKQFEISRLFDELPRGIFIFSCPKDMTVGVSEKCKARIVSKTYLSAFEKRLRERIGEEFGELELQYISSIINVKLVSESFLSQKAFDIKPKEDGGDQLVVDKDFTSWEWDVTPQESGTKRLKFIVSVIIQVDGYQKLPPKRYEENEVEIAVKVNPVFSLSNFLRENRRYLVTLIFIGLVLVFIVRTLKIVGTTIEVGSIGDINLESNEGAINLLGISRDIRVEENQNLRGALRYPNLYEPDVVYELIKNMPNSLSQIKRLLEKLRQFVDFNPLLSTGQKIHAFEKIKCLIQICVERKPGARTKAYAEITELEEVTAFTSND